MKIRITRNKSFIDYFRSYTVLLNGIEIGKVKNGDSFVYPINPDSSRHSLQLKIDWCYSNVVYFDAHNTELTFECGNNYQGWRIFKGVFAMLNNPENYLWLRNTH